MVRIMTRTPHSLAYAPPDHEHGEGGTPQLPLHLARSMINPVNRGVDVIHRRPRCNAGRHGYRGLHRGQDAQARAGVWSPARYGTVGSGTRATERPNRLPSHNSPCTSCTLVTFA